MNADVEKAVEALKWLAGHTHVRAIDHIVTLRQALRDQEAEITRLKDAVMRMEGELSTAMLRTALSEALLRECALHFIEASQEILDWGSYASSHFQEKHDLLGAVAQVKAYADRITAHLGGEHER